MIYALFLSSERQVIALCRAVLLWLSYWTKRHRQVIFQGKKQTERVIFNAVYFDNGEISAVVI